MTRARKRRGRGEGSISQRSEDGLWVARRSAGYGPDGKRRRLVAYGRTKGEAMGKLRTLQGLDPRVGVADRVTLAGFLDNWLAIVKPRVEPNTYGPYERHVRLHLVPVIGHVALAKLAPIDVQVLYARLGDQGVSPALARKVGTTLTVALGEAVSMKLITSNPARLVKKPKAARPEIKVLDPDQVQAFLGAARQDRLYPLYLTALDTGMRPGELFALVWEDVDLRGGYVIVRRSLEDIGGHLRVKEVKTKKGRRRIDLAETTIRTLRSHRLAMARLGFGDGPVFPNTVGTWLRIGDVTKDSFKPILARAKLAHCGLYTLRHTMATLLLLADENPKVVSERLGHSSITLTLDTYSHVLPTMGKRAALKMNLILDRGPQKGAKRANGHTQGPEGQGTPSQESP
jgi:integrase